MAVSSGKTAHPFFRVQRPTEPSSPQSPLRLRNPSANLFDTSSQNGRSQTTAHLPNPTTSRSIERPRTRRSTYPVPFHQTHLIANTRFLYLGRSSTNTASNAASPKPGTSLSSSESTCYTYCMEKYMAAWNTVSRQYLGHVQRNASGAGASSGGGSGIF